MASKHCTVRSLKQPREARILSLVPSAVSEETVETLKELYLAARAGAVIGIACVVIGPRYLHTARVAGEAKRNPTFTRGTIRGLEEMVDRVA